MAVSTSKDREGEEYVGQEGSQRASTYSIIAKPEVDTGISKMFHFFTKFNFCKICII